MISQGWKVFRIGYNENNEETINEFLTYISKIEAGEKELPNRMFKYSEIKKPKRTWEEWTLQKNNLNLELNKPLIDLVKNSDIDFSKFGWVGQVAILIDKKPQKINEWMKKYMLEFYETKCFKRK